MTLIAASDSDPKTHKWSAVNTGTFEKDFAQIVSPELAQNIVSRLRQGEVVELPNRYKLAEVQGKFGGRWSD